MASALRRGKGGALDAIVNLCTRRGFVFPGSGVHGAVGTSYDYGPLGTQMRKNLVDLWWREFVQRRPDVHGLDTGVLLNPDVWRSSGHVDNFSDPLTECRACNHRARADKLAELALSDAGVANPEAVASGMTVDELTATLHEHSVCCPECGADGADGLGPVVDVNLLFQTRIGPFSSPSTPDHHHNPRDAYLRPETAQGAYVQLPNVAAAMRLKLPFGLAQVGKAFRNEIRTANFVFRAREFEQLELQYFADPASSASVHADWVAACHDWLVSAVGLRAENVRRREYGAGELAHYALATTDLEYRYPFGWDELWGVANRGDYDLNLHTAATGVGMAVPDGTGAAKVTPHVIEPALGLGRLLLATLVDAYTVEEVPDAKGGAASRVVLKLHPSVAPYQAAVLPLTKKDGLLECARDVHHRMTRHVTADMDVTGSIGKRYRRQDEIGTPFCVTVDYDTLADNSVTVRFRDSMQQARVSVEALSSPSALDDLVALQQQ